MQQKNKERYGEEILQCGLSPIPCFDEAEKIAGFRKKG